MLFVLPSFNYGGTMTAFKNLLQILDKDLFMIDVLAIVDDGDARAEIEAYANVLNSPNHRETGRISIKAGMIRLLRVLKKVIANIGIDMAPIILARLAKKTDCSTYDTVIGFQEGYATYFVSKLNARHKVVWVHAMFSRVYELETLSNLNAYKYVNSIVCVSETAKRDMVKAAPYLKDKICVVYNCLINERIRELGNVGPSVFDKNVINIVSVGRIDPVKRFSIIPVVLNGLLKKNLNVHWHIIGGVDNPNEFKSIKAQVKKYNLENSLILEGPKQNPYPYIASSDLLVCMSSSETFNYTLTEARILGIPVVTTDFPAAFEFVNNGVDGVISPISNLEQTIYEILSNHIKYQELKNKLKEYSYNNNIAKNQFIELLNNKC